MTAQDTLATLTTTLRDPETGSADDWRKAAAGLTFRHRAFINGDFKDAESGKTFSCFSPLRKAPLADVAECDQADVNRAASAARTAFDKGSWSRTDPAHRKQVLFRLADLIEKHRAEFALLDTLDMGKPISDSLTADVPEAVSLFRWYAETLDKVYEEIAPVAPGNLAMIKRPPLGVVGAVVPWNYPLDMATWKVAPALAVGNSVILKPAEQSPLSALFLAELATEAGIPDGVFNVVTGFGESAGAALGRHPDIDCLAFTGSTEVGKFFLGYAGESNMKRVWLECGGKSPNVVFADYDNLDEVAEKAALGIFFNQGQVCSANSRLVVERSIKDALVAKIAERARSLRPADPLDPATKLGALVNQHQTDRVMSYIAIGREEANLVVGGERVTLGESDCYIEPTIFDEVATDDRIAQEEIFGPVLSVIAFDKEEEAVTIANNSPYGLAASLWTRDLSRAHRLSERLIAGSVSVNTVDAISFATPFGGLKQSGIGSDLSLHALDKYTAMKTVWIKYE